MAKEPLYFYKVFRSQSEFTQWQREQKGGVRVFSVSPLEFHKREDRSNYNLEAYMVIMVVYYILDSEEVIE